MYYGAFYKINVYLTHWLYWIHRWPLLLFNIDILCRIPCVHIHNSYIRRKKMYYVSQSLTQQPFCIIRLVCSRIVLLSCGLFFSQPYE